MRAKKIIQRFLPVTKDMDLVMNVLFTEGVQNHHLVMTIIFNDQNIDLIHQKMSLLVFADATHLIIYLFYRRTPLWKAI